MSQALLLSVVVTAHGEGRLLRPTLRSIDAAIRYVDGDVELLLVCDTPDAETLREVTRWSELPHPYIVRVEQTEFGESGAARNAGVTKARGEFLALVDGDDLVSDNYFAVGIDTVKNAPGEVVAHPEWMLSFGRHPLLWRTDSSAAGGFDYRDLLRHNLWPSSSVARRATFATHAYRSLPPGHGYGPEDWLWNIETVIAGIAHEPAPDTSFYYRLRESGGVNNRHRYSVLPRFNLEGLRRALPAPEGPYTAAVQVIPPRGPKRIARAVARRGRAVVVRAYRGIRPLGRRLSARWSPELKTVVYRTARGGRGLFVSTPRRRERPVISPVVRAQIRAAAEFDPAISWSAFALDSLPIWKPRDDGYGRVLDRALLELGDARALVTVPWVGVGGADLVSLNYARALQQSERFRGRTAILGTYLEERTQRDLIPTDIPYAHLDARWRRFHVDLQPRLLPQLLALLGPELVISVNCFHLTQSLENYHRPIVEGRRVYATLFAFDRIGDGLPVNPITDDNQRRYLDHIAGLITDNSTTTALIGDILGLEPPRVLTHRQPVSNVTPELPRGTSAYNNEYFSEKNPFRLVWPHRLDEEKRPDAVVAIARALREKGLPAVIDIWGQRVLTDEGDTLMKDLADAGVVYRGPYSGGLSALPTHEYHALLLTSKSEGLPLVLVQSLFEGLPVIASAVGGVPDIVIDGETGLLTAGPDDVDGYVDAVERLMASRELRRTVIEGGYRHAARLHSWESFVATVEESVIS